MKEKLKNYEFRKADFFPIIGPLLYSARNEATLPFENNLEQRIYENGISESGAKWVREVQTRKAVLRAWNYAVTVGGALGLLSILDKF